MRIFHGGVSSTCNQWTLLSLLSALRSCLVMLSVLLALPILAQALTSVSLSPSLASPQQTNTPITLTATPTGGATMQYQFWVYNANAIPAWSQLQGYSASPTCTWTPSSPGTYLLSATALDTSTSQTENDTLWYTVTNPPLSAVSVATTVDSPQLTNTSIMLVAAATGGDNVQYQFWLYNPTATPSWSQLQAYSTQATYLWTPTAPANYLLSVTARDGNTGVEVNNSFWYTITTPPITAVSLVATPASPQATNTPVTFTATPIGGTSVQYQFWLYNPAASPAWSQLQALSATATCQWTPTTPGNYMLSATAQDANNTVVNTTLWFTVTGTPLTGVTVAASPNSPRQIGTTITFIAAATGGTNVQYQFWLYNPAASPAWNQLQAFSTQATCAWIPSAPGSYLLVVTAQDGITGMQQIGTLPWYTITSSPLTSIAVTALPASPQLANTPITLTAAATGGYNVQFQFWTYNSAVTPAWNQLQGYSSSATCVWTPLIAGNYVLSITALDNVSGMMANKILSYTVTFNQGISLSANSTNVSVTDNATGLVALNSSYPAQTSVTATVYQNGLPAAGQTVTFSGNPQLGSFSTSTATTDSNGLAVVTYQAGSVAGQLSLSASSGAVTSQPVVITQYPGSAAQIILTLAPQVLTSATPTKSAGSVTVNDANGNGVPNQSVTLMLTSSSPLIVLDTASPVITNANGQATFNVLSHDVSGNAAVTATIASLSSGTQSVTFSAKPDPQLIGGSLTQNVAAGTATQLTLQFIDPTTWLPLPNTSVWARVLNPGIGATPYLLSNTGGLSSASNPTTMTQTIQLTTDSNGYAYVTYTAANQLANGITLTCYTTAQMQSANAYPTSIHFNVILLGPASVMATPVSATQINLSWTASANALSYQVQRSTDGLNWSTLVANLATTAAATMTYSDGASGTPLLPATTYYYQVCINTTVGSSQFSAVASALTYPAAPAAPAATPVSASEIDLTWNTVPGATSYRVFYQLATATAYTQYGADIAPSANATYPTFPVTGLLPSTKYNFEIAAVDASGATNSAPVSATTIAVVTFSSYAAKTNSPKIYYSSAQNDLISTAVPLTTPITITCYVSNGMSPVGTTVTIFTNKGTFVPNGLTQTVSADMKTVTGTLGIGAQNNGVITVIFQGRPPTAISSNGLIVYPTLAELGSPSLVVTAASGANLSQNAQVASTLPVLIGPPNNIAMTITNPVTPVNLYFTTNLNTPWGYANQTLNVVATVYDLNGNTVLANMPIWFGQSWAWFGQSPSVTNVGNLTSQNAVNYYQSAVDAGYIRPPLAQTDQNGAVQNIGFGSNHSGEYTLQCFALIPNADTTTLGTINNINSSYNNGANWNSVQQNILYTDNTNTTPVFAAQNIWIDTKVAFNTSTGASGWEDPPSVIVGGTTTQTPPDNFQGISSDGTQSAIITVKGKDFDGKYVLPGTPFTVSATIWMPNYSLVAPQKQQVGSPQLYEYGGLTGTPMPAGTLLYFNNLSQGAVICKGNNIIGYVTFTYDSTASQPSTWTTGKEVLYIFGPNPWTTANVSFSSIPQASCKTYLLSGKDVDCTALAPTSTNCTIIINTNTGQPFPDGYMTTLVDANNTGGLPALSMDGQTGELLNGTTSLQYCWDLGTNPFHVSSLYLYMKYYLADGLHIITNSDDYDVTLGTHTAVSNKLIFPQGLAGPQIPVVIAPAVAGSIAIDAAAVAGVVPVQNDVYLPLGNPPLSLTATITGPATVTGATIDDTSPLPGWNISYQWVAVPNTNSPAPPSYLAQNPTDAKGVITASIPMNAFTLGPGVYQLQIDGGLAGGVTVSGPPVFASSTLGTTGNIHAGFFPPTVTVNNAQITATTIPLIIHDPNVPNEPNGIPNGLQYIVTYVSGANVNTLIVPASGLIDTPCTLTGLTTKTTYSITATVDLPANAVSNIAKTDDQSLASTPAALATTQ